MFRNAHSSQFDGEYTNVEGNLHQTNRTYNYNFTQQQLTIRDIRARKKEGASLLGPCHRTMFIASEASNHSLGVEPANKQSQTLRNRILAKIGRCVTVGFVASPVLVHSV